ncbi:MAG: hypothetical protein ABR910_02585 [Acidobacteriaceae bacterium]|jgi:hypothetical protein
MQGRGRNFKITEQANVPTGRHGKHRDITSRILDDLDGLEKGMSLKIPLSELPDTKVNIRSALSRASRKFGKSLGTAADDDYLYVWNIEPDNQQAG